MPITAECNLAAANDKQPFIKTPRPGVIDYRIVWDIMHVVSENHKAALLKAP